MFAIIPRCSHVVYGYDKMTVMADNNQGNPVTHFGRQVRKERLAHGLTLAELAERAGIVAPHLSRIENGHRPPTEAVALAMDAVFPERNGWFLEFYEESKSWAPAGFRDWPEHEDRSRSLRVWAPGVIHGLAQTAGYARALLGTMPGATEQVIATRLASRLERQRRVIRGDDPPATWFVFDEPALYRLAGTPEIMAEQMEHLVELAGLPHVTLQVLPAIAHAATVSELIIADGAAYAEHLVGGYVFTDDSTVSWLVRLFATINAECYRASQSLALIERTRDRWITTGASPLIAVPTAGPV